MVNQDARLSNARWEFYVYHGYDVGAVLEWNTTVTTAALSSVTNPPTPAVPQEELVPSECR